MTGYRLMLSIALLATPLTLAGASQSAKNPSENAALRYWPAFAEMQDSAITAGQAKELNQILGGTAPYNDSVYGELVEKNREALATMARGAALPYCNWGIDYQLGPNAPVDYVRKALELGRLNVLYAFHLSLRRDEDGAVRALAAGVRFSREVANGGTLFATLVAEKLLFIHFRAMAFLLHVARPPLSASQRLVLRNALAQLGPEGLDWQSAMKRELAVLNGYDSVSSAALKQIASLYEGALNDPPLLPKLQETIRTAPPPLPGLIPNPKRVIAAKDRLVSQIHQIEIAIR
jgi:hypothetical protein